MTTKKQPKKVLGSNPLKRVEADKKEDAKEKELPPDWQQIKGLDKDRMSIQFEGQVKRKLDYGTIVQEARALAILITEKEAQLKQLKEAGAYLLAKHDIKRVSVDDRGTTRRDGKSTWLSKTKLLDKGVDPAIIADSYESKTYSTLDLGIERNNGKEEKE
jgi:hypothetical protein